jgi:hypothetical protein
LIWRGGVSAKYFCAVTNCWAVLEIAPTHNQDEISKARRALIRKWHPDTVMDRDRQNEYTVRCATINAAYDEAVKIAEIRERVLRPNSPPIDVDAFELRHSSNLGDRPYTEATYRFMYRAVFVVVTYFLGFRVFVPATGLAIVFAAGIVIAATLDLILYRYAVRPFVKFLGFQEPTMAPWIILELANLAALARWFYGAHELFQAGLLMAIPLWRLKRWVKAR